MNYVLTVVARFYISVKENICPLINPQINPGPALGSDFYRLVITLVPAISVFLLFFLVQRIFTFSMQQCIAISKNSYTYIIHPHS